MFKVQRASVARKYNEGKGEWLIRAIKTTELRNLIVTSWVILSAEMLTEQGLKSFTDVNITENETA